MLKSTYNPTLKKTLEEVLSPKQAIVLHALISARFDVSLKVARTVDEPPPSLPPQESLNISVSLIGKSDPRFFARIRDYHLPEDN
jgi:hypothetical protein